MLTFSCSHSTYKSNKPRAEKPLTNSVVGTAASKKTVEKTPEGKSDRKYGQELGPSS